MNSNENTTENAPAGIPPDHEKHHCGCRRRCWKIPFIVAAIVLVKSAIVMLLWNALIPAVFHGPVLTYVQSIELVILVTLLVVFVPRPGMRHGPFSGGPFGFGRHRWRERWAALTPEEREKLRDEIRKHCG